MKRKSPRQEYQENKKTAKEDQESYYRQKLKERSRSFLPDPEVLENYNYVLEGSADRILKMVEMEQKHRQEFELNQQRYVAVAQFVGAVCLAAVAALIINSYKHLVEAKQSEQAIILLVVGFTFLGGSILLNFRKAMTKTDTKNKKNHKTAVDEDEE